MTKSILTTELLLEAYKQGYFPMPEPETEDIVWFNPDPRAILPLDQLKVSRSLRRKLNRPEFSCSFDKDFVGVVEACADREDTWINAEIKSAYTRLHEAGHAHSLEIWEHDQLVGGVYGVAIGCAFFAESKFHRATDASKMALYHLVQHLQSLDYHLLEVQFLTPHLASLGVVEIPAADYMLRLAESVAKKPRGPWA